jgi:hypothetical protein
MRHRIGLILAVVMVGVLFFPGAWGYLRLLRLPVREGQLAPLPAAGGSLLGDGHLLLALAAVAGAGLLAGILIAVPWFSPLAAGLPGLLLLGWTGLFLASVRQAADLIPLRSDPFGAGFEAMLFNGVLSAAGLAMILPMFVPSRWRTRQADGGGDADADEFVSSWSEPAQAPPAELAKQPTAWSEPAQAAPAELPKRSTLPWDTTPGPGPAAPAKPAD